jgi:hypothetical protein
LDLRVGGRVITEVIELSPLMSVFVRSTSHSDATHLLTEECL